jgi:hypothetical protein
VGIRAGISPPRSELGCVAVVSNSLHAV